jgi:hypothetical protein
LLFIVLHTQEKTDVDVSVDPEQRQWLAGQLARARQPVVVLMHHSAADQDLRGNRWFDGREALCLVRERRELQQLLASCPWVRLVVNGHLHWNHLDIVHGIPFVTLQSLVENLDDDAPGRAARAHAVIRLTDATTHVAVRGAEPATYQVEHGSGRAGR